MTLESTQWGTQFKTLLTLFNFISENERFIFWEYYVFDRIFPTFARNHRSPVVICIQPPRPAWRLDMILFLVGMFDDPITWNFEKFIEILKTGVFIKFLSILENFWTLKNKLLDIRRVNSFRFELR